MLKKIKRCMCFLITFLMITSSLSGLAYAQSIDESPRVDDVRGSVIVYRAGGHSNFAVYRGMNIYDGDLIITGLNSSATISYYGQTLTMGELTTLSLNAIWQRHGRNESSITLVEGMVKVRVDVQLDDNSRNSVQAGGTIVGVRGTKYILTYRRMLFGDDGVGDGNPFVRMLVIDGGIVVNLPDPDNLGDVATFMVTPQGMIRVFEDAYGSQTFGEMEALGETFSIPLESLDLSLLEAIRNDPSAMALNPDLFRYIDQAIDQRRAEDDRRMALLEERPPPQIIVGSDAAQILPNLQRPSDTPPADTPGAGPEGPGTGTDAPSTGTDGPGTGTDGPGTGTDGPGTGTDGPGTGTDGPGTGTDTPADTPVDTPADTPVDTPIDTPVETPPVETPPVETPPVQTPPTNQPNRPGSGGGGTPPPPPPPPPVEVVMAVTPNTTPLTATANSLTFEIAVSGFGSEASSASVRPTLGAVSGLSFAGYDVAGVWDAATQTRTFEITVTYDGTTAFPTGEASLAINLTSLNAAYTFPGGEQSKTVYIADPFVTATATVTPAEQALSPLDNTLTFNVVASGFTSADTSAAVRPVMPTITGLTFTGQATEGVWNATTQTRTFTITATYNGTTAFPTTEAELNIGLTGLGSYVYTPDSPLTLDIDIFDGQAAGARAIPVTQANIQRPVTGFNAALNSTAVLRTRHFVLVEDVTLSANWVRIPATPDNVPAGGGFSGSFDGDGNTISGLTLTVPASQQQAGMFSRIEPSGAVRNLGLTNVNIANTLEAANSGIRMGGIAAINHGTIDNSSVSGGTITMYGLTAVRHVGGIVGENAGGTISNSFAMVDMNVPINRNATHVGGIAGHNTVAGTITNSVALNSFMSAGGGTGATPSRLGRVTNNDLGTQSNNFARDDMTITLAAANSIRNTGVGDGVSIAAENVTTVQALLTAPNAPNLSSVIAFAAPILLPLISDYLCEDECICNYENLYNLDRDSYDNYEHDYGHEYGYGDRSDHECGHKCNYTMSGYTPNENGSYSESVCDANGNYNHIDNDYGHSKGYSPDDTAILGKSAASGERARVRKKYNRRTLC